MMPSERIAQLEAKLFEARRRLAIAETRLRLMDCELPDELPAWASELQPAAAALLDALLQAYPRVLNRWQLDEMVPKRDHAKERTDKVIDQYVHRVRQVLGDDVIENVHGSGWRCSAAFHRQHGAQKR